MAKDYRIERELSGPIPRQVSRKRSTRIGGLGLGWIVLFPFIAVGIGLASVAGGSTLFVFLLAVFGNTLPGQITGHRMQTNQDGTATNYYLRFSYQTGGTTYQRTALVSQASYKAIADRAQVSVKVFPLTPGFGAHLRVPGNKSIRLWGIWLAAFVCNGFTGSIVCVTVLHVIEDRSLVARGQAVPGQIVERLVRGHDGDGETDVRYVLRYVYAPLGSVSRQAVNTGLVPVGVPLQGEMTVDSKRSFDSVAVGDQVTVLYRPGQPKKSLIYRFADHMVPSCPVRTSATAADGVGDASRQRRRQRRGKWNH